MPEPRPSLESLFAEALERPDAAARAAYLDAACANEPELRRQVETLLGAHDRAAGGFLAHGSEATLGPQVEVGDATETYEPRSLQPGTLVAGKYRLIDRIGEGGMGAVWRAEQTQPVRRMVAIKLIKPGMDSRAVLARFEAERQALAVMDHPNIARVLDAGMADDGRPFFVMELVKGVPITRYCDENRLSPRRRLELFVPVCQAIQHAHQKGVIHRDIKPSNVLVALYDDRPVPKVIDFGVAKATGQSLTDLTLHTGFGAVVGTPEYMSPEQASLNNLDIDTRSDVYSLGVLLYELLAGSPPFRSDELRRAGVLEILRVVREDEAPRPSTKLSTAEGRPSIAATRGTDAQSLATLLRGELDWLVMKAIEKDRSRRYETANGLGADIQRFLAGEPVLAVPPSAGYRARKFLRKHRTAVTAAALVFLALLAGVAGTTFGLIHAERQRHAALAARQEAELQRAEAEQQRRVAEDSRQDAEGHRKRAEEREAMAIDAVKRFRDAVTTEPELKNNPGLEPLRKRLLQEPLEFFKGLREKLQADGDTRPEALQRLGSAAFDLGNLTAEIGDKQNALLAHEEALAIRERLAREIPNLTEFSSDLANSHHKIAALQSETGHPDQALASNEKALAIRERLARENPSVTEFARNFAGSHNNIGNLQKETAHPDAALASYEKALAIWERLARENRSVTEFARDLAGSLNNIGSVQSQTGHPDLALASCEKALAIRERLARENPSVTEFSSDLAESHNNIGLLQSEMVHTEEALPSYEKALAIWERLARENPSVTEFSSDLAECHNNIGLLQRKTGHPDQALDSNEKALAIQERLARENPSVTEFARALARSHNNIGLLQKETGHPGEALASNEKALAIQQRLARENPSVTEFSLALAGSHNNIGRLQNETGHPDEALASYEKALAICERLARENPSVTRFSSDLAVSHLNIGVVQGVTGHPDQALASYEKALAICERLTRENPSVPKFSSNLALCHNYIGLIQKETGHPDKALASYEKALAIWERLTRENPSVTDFASELGDSLNNVAMLEIAERRFAAARQSLRSAIGWQEKALVANPRNPKYRQFLRNHFTGLIDAAQGLGDSALEAEARRGIAELDATDPKLLALDHRLEAIIRGDAPRDTPERLTLAQRAYDTKRYATAARLWAEALESDPSLAANRQTQHPYNAACAAALAASGGGQAEPSPDEAARAELRQQARNWLTSELATWSNLLGSFTPEQRTLLVRTLRHWQEDPDFASVRDPDAIAALPQAERAPWLTLWANVNTLLAQAEGRNDSAGNPAHPATLPTEAFARP